MHRGSSCLARGDCDCAFVQYVRTTLGRNRATVKSRRYGDGRAANCPYNVRTTFASRTPMSVVDGLASLLFVPGSRQVPRPGIEVIELAQNHGPAVLLPHFHGIALERGPKAMKWVCVHRAADLETIARPAPVLLLEPGQHPLLVRSEIAVPQRARQILVEIGEEVEARRFIVARSREHGMARDRSVGRRNVCLFHGYSPRLPGFVRWLGPACATVARLSSRTMLAPLIPVPVPASAAATASARARTPDNVRATTALHR